jgi:hypothetical protein
MKIRCGTCGHEGVGAAYNHDCYWVFRERMTKKNPNAVALGRRGGKSVSTRKADASRENGKKGGRPPMDQLCACGHKRNTHPGGGPCMAYAASPRECQCNQFTKA